LNGYITSLAPDGTTVVRITSLGDCSNSYDSTVSFLSIGNIFDEGVGEPNEWNSESLINASVVSSNPYNGIKSLDLASSFTAQYKTTNSITDTSSSTVTIWVKLKATAPTNWRLHMSVSLNGSGIGTYDLFEANSGGFDRSSLVYQEVTFDLSGFSPFTYNELEFHSSNFTDGMYADVWNLSYV